VCNAAESLVKTCNASTRLNICVPRHCFQAAAPLCASERADKDLKRER